MLTRIQNTSSQSRDLEVAVAVGAREEYSTELHLLGSATFRGQKWNFGGTTWLRAERDNPEIELFRLDTGEKVIRDVALDILHAIFSVLDAETDGIVQRELERIEHG